MDHLVKKLSLKVDVEALRQEVTEILSRFPFTEDQGQLNLLTRNAENQDPYESAQSLYDDNLLPICREHDFRHFLKPWQDGHICRLYSALKESTGTELGRLRLMRLRPKTCYSFHVDDNCRYHLALQTRRTCFLAFREGLFHVPSDGHLYWVNTLQAHSAFNASNVDRIHLVFSSASGTLNATIRSKNDL